MDNKKKSDTNLGGDWARDDYKNGYGGDYAREDHEQPAGARGDFYGTDRNDSTGIEVTDENGEVKPGE